MRTAAILASPLAFVLLSTEALAVDCAPFRPDAPVEQSAETEIRAEVGGLLSKLIQAEGDYRVADAQRVLSADAKDPDSLIRWQSKLYYFCEALNEDESISTRDRIEIMRGVMDASSDAQLDEAIDEDIQKSEVIDGTGLVLESCIIKNRVLSCDFLAQTAETAKDIYVYAGSGNKSSRLIDNQGNTYLATLIDFGGRESKQYVQTSLPPDVPMRGRLTFENISNRATSAAIIEVNGRLDKKDIPPFEFRDVTFE